MADVAACNAVTAASGESNNLGAVPGLATDSDASKRKNNKLPATNERARVKSCEYFGVKLENFIL